MVSHPELHCEPSRNKKKRGGQQKSVECQPEEAGDRVAGSVGVGEGGDRENWGKKGRDYRQCRRHQGLARVCGCACEWWGVGRWWCVSRARRGCENSLFPGSLPPWPGLVGGGQS